VLDVRVVRTGGDALQVDLVPSDTSFKPVQRELELRLPPEYAAVHLDIRSVALRRRGLENEGRERLVASARIPLAAGSYTLNR
jgi:hypothetical protein